MKRFAFLFGFAAVVAMLCAQQSGEATTYHIEKDYTLYGNLDQDDIPVIGACACGPTAAVNSFVYLENAYPWAYNRWLIPDTNPANGLRDYQELIDVATILGGANYMNTKNPGGTWDDMFIYGKWRYIEDQWPGWTIYEAQLSSTWGWAGARLPDEIPPIEKPSWVADNTYPTWRFLYDELVDCEDVEILVSWYEGGHFLTLTSFYWDDVDEDGFIDFDEDAWIDYIDPQTGAWGLSNIWHSGTGFIETDVTSGAWISMAVSESPIPEPATIALIGCGLVALAGTVRRKLR